MTPKIRVKFEWRDVKDATGKGWNSWKSKAFITEHVVELHDAAKDAMVKLVREAVAEGWEPERNHG